MSHIDETTVTTCCTHCSDLLLLRLDNEFGLGIVTLFAEHKLLDEDVEDLLQLVSVVGSVDDVPIVLLVDLGLSAQLTTEELRRVRGWTSKSLSDFQHVDDYCFDAVALSFYLSEEFGHLVPVELVCDLTVDVKHLEPLIM